MDDDRAAQLSLSVSRGPQHLGLAVCDRPTGADLSNHATADVCSVGAVKHLADNDICELSEWKQVEEPDCHSSDRQ